jgi:hypothetical protein
VAKRQKKEHSPVVKPQRSGGKLKNPFLEFAQDQLLEVEKPPNCGCFQLRQLTIVKQSANSDIQFQRSLANKSANAILKADSVSH